MSTLFKSNLLLHYRAAGQHCICCSKAHYARRQLVTLNNINLRDTGASIMQQSTGRTPTVGHSQQHNLTWYWRQYHAAQHRKHTDSWSLSTTKPYVILAPVSRSKAQDAHRQLVTLKNIILRDTGASITQQSTGRTQTIGHSQKHNPTQ